MSWLSLPDNPQGGHVDLVVEPITRDLGDGFRVRRALPGAGKRMVGPFMFLDHMGPAILPAGKGLDVRPHPHIGLATLTYLTQGQILHRDSLGSTQPIDPGDVNWMTAGRGIVHSERTEAGLRAEGHTLTGIQSWIALPQAHEETAPGFIHRSAAELPHLQDQGVSARVIVGSMFGETSPVSSFSPMFYVDAHLQAGAAMPLPPDYAERAAYVIDGELEITGETYGPHRLLVFRPGDAMTLRATADTRVLLLGGEPMDGPRHLWWNFVHSSKDRIEAAKADWKAGRFASVPGDNEFIPLPD